MMAPLALFVRFLVQCINARGLIKGGIRYHHEALEKDLPWRLKEPRVLEILQAIDANTDGLVDFFEFVAAALHVHQLEGHDMEKWKLRSKTAFEKFDMDKDGYITPEELHMELAKK
ncbi:calcium-dependent protein kinase 18-like [Iris pallida]|uniref:Calcium-dependent protein kinase 18-like n=1 Tax=Iris pallida TaxID=29817 RepID=A0AAX6EM34_IRIPA|nr:calcium-dependent protein kinase 18-like [Iris pallida]KAJ6806606.1 calcium-dependent protein kinase 18-like [Iris pallida]